MCKWGSYFDDESSTESITLVKSRWAKAIQDLEEAKYLEKLIFKDFVNTIRNTKTVWDYRIPMIKEAQTEIGKKKKKERENLSYIETELKNSFFKDEDRIDVKVHTIMSGGFEGYYWQLCLTIAADEFIIQIPSRDLLDLKNIKDAHEGRFVFYKRESSCCIAVQFEDWSENGFAKQMKEYFDKYFSDVVISEGENV